ncbi:filament polymerization regulator ParJ [Leucobacter tardus]|nr:PAC2 family protein [Leucobacter tardus]
MTESADQRPPRPRIMIAAFEGWSDAGAATTTVLQHLAELIDAEVLHAIGAEGYVDFQVHRPKLIFDDQGERILDWPDTRLYGKIQRPGAEPVDAETETVRRIDGTPVTDLFLLAGVEPARDWLSFAEEIVELVDVWDIDSVILLGSMFSDAPHSRPIAISMSSENPARRAETGAERSTYEGPAGISTVVDLALAAEGIESLSLWAQVPHYVHSAPSPKATLAILDRLEELLDIVIPRGALLDEATEWEANIDRIAATDEEMTQYIRRLEESRDANMAAETTGDALALEFEKFLEQPRADHTTFAPAPGEPGEPDAIDGADEPDEDAPSTDPVDDGDGTDPGAAPDASDEPDTDPRG